MFSLNPESAPIGGYRCLLVTNHREQCRGLHSTPFLVSLQKKNNACEDLLHLQQLPLSICFSKAPFIKKYRDLSPQWLPTPSLPAWSCSLHTVLSNRARTFILGVFGFFWFFKTGFLYSFVACTGTCSVYQAGLKLRDLCASASQMLRLKASVTTAWNKAPIERIWLWLGSDGACL